MQLFYTGALGPDKPQTDSSKSLGGFVSGSLIPNGGLNNVFPAITRDQVKNVLFDTRLIVIKNTLGVVANNVRIWTIRSTYSTYKIAGVLPAVDACSRQVFESILNGNTLPYQATLTSHEGEGNALVAGNLVVNGLIGIWIQRELDLTQFTELDGLQGAASMDCPTMIAKLQAQNGSTVYDEGSLIIDWS